MTPPDDHPAPRPPSALDRWADRARLGRTGHLSTPMAFLMRWLVTPWARLWFRPHLDGWEHLPDGPFLLVSNHSGGAGGELFCLAALWYARFGRAERPITGLALPSAFFFPVVAWALRGFGAIPATYHHAHGALRDGVPVLVFPGGAHEAIRPVWRARQVDFGGRQGYLRIAADAHVPIVPMAIWGSHFASPILWRSRVLPWLLIAPRVFGLKTWPLSVLGLAGCAAILASTLWIPWWAALVLAGAWLASPFPLLPWLPWRVRVRIGTPILPDDTPAHLDATAARVQTAVQDLLNTLANEHTMP